MNERGISRVLLESALRIPTKIWYDDDGRVMFKKLYRKRNKERLLLVIAETHEQRANIITVIETSKVKKYL